MSSTPNPPGQITVQIDPEAAKAYNSASPELKQKIRILFSAWIKEVTSNDKSALTQLMDKISKNAQTRGITPEILEKILSE